MPRRRKLVLEWLFLGLFVGAIIAGAIAATIDEWRDGASNTRWALALGWLVPLVVFGVFQLVVMKGGRRGPGLWLLPGALALIVVLEMVSGPTERRTFALVVFASWLLAFVPAFVSNGAALWRDAATGSRAGPR